MPLALLSPGVHGAGRFLTWLSVLFRADAWWYVSPLAGVALVLGVLISHHEMFGSGFARTPGDPSDAVLVHFSLEHDYLWLIRQSPHKSYWDTPMFYPEKGTTAHTDLMLGTLPFYAPFRLLGMAPDSAFQTWLLLVCGLNFVACYWMLRDVLRFPDLASVAGAYLFAFAGSRIAQEWHPQLVPCFYLVASLAGLCLALSGRQVLPGWIIFFGGVIAQIYTAYYYAWFYAFGGLIGLILALAWYQQETKALVLRDFKLLLPCTAVALAACMPFAMQSIAVAQEVGLRSYDAVRGFLPGFPSWIKQGSWNWFYAWLDDRLRTFQTAGFWEESNGIGLVTTALVLSGLWLGRTRLAARIVFMIAIAMAILSFRTPSGWSLWKGVHDFIPGAGGLRAVGRVGLMMLLPAGIALASAVERMSRSAGVVVLLAVGLEQGGNPPTYEKLSFRNAVTDISTHIQPDCESFLFSPGRDWTPVLAHTTAIWAVNRSGVPTLNAASGGDPPNWKFADSRILTESDRLQLRAGLDQWHAAHREIASVCWIQASGDGSLRTERVRFGR